MAAISPEAFSRPLDIGPPPFTPIFYDGIPIGYPGTPGMPDNPPDDTPPPTAMPEPPAFTLIVFGLLAIAGIANRQRRKPAA
jgi:hypothetical protein